MAALIKLHRPEGFRDSDKWALKSTGELLRWPRKDLNPKDFNMDQYGNMFHNCPEGKSWSRVVRHGENANNFFKAGRYIASVKETAEIRPPPPKPEKKTKYISHSSIVSYKGTARLRNKKYKNKKYKNSRRRLQKKKDKQHRQKMKKKRKKIFKKECASVKKSQKSISLTICKYCEHGSNFCNMFLDPQTKHSCDFCGKYFNGLQLKGDICENCLYINYNNIFCNECEKNLGKWEIDWRMKLYIPRYQHPNHCYCQECYQFRWAKPCFECGMTCHTAQYCPWRIAAFYHDDYYDYY